MALLSLSLLSKHFFVCEDDGKNEEDSKFVGCVVAYVVVMLELGGDGESTRTEEDVDVDGLNVFNGGVDGAGVLDVDGIADLEGGSLQWQPPEPQYVGM